MVYQDVELGPGVMNANLERILKVRRESQLCQGYCVLCTVKPTESPQTGGGWNSDCIWLMRK